jgi:hypothetical protein
MYDELDAKVADVGAQLQQMQADFGRQLSEDIEDCRSIARDYRINSDQQTN